MEPVETDLSPELTNSGETPAPAKATEVRIGGRSAKRRGLWWMLRQPHGTSVIRVFGYVVAKVLRRAADEVTFDRVSFESALARVPNGTLVIIAPSHRSYMDFLLCSYLFFDQPDLAIAIPHIAAAQEFSRIPVLGRLFEKGQAFFIKRGMRRGDYVELTTRVTDLVKRRQTLQVFIEGTRSRSRQFLPPHHGLLKCIQETGQPATILPIALSYDRVTEEASFLRELQGSPKPEMKLRTLSNWTTRLVRGKIKIGRVHIACGAPVKLDKFDRLRDVAEAVMGQLQAQTITTTLHLRSFLEHHPIQGVELEWLCDAIAARGGRVLPSACAGPQKVTTLLERCMHYHWMHLFYAEARAAFPENPAIQHHISRNGFLQTPTVTAGPLEQDTRVEQLLFTLFGPICSDYALVARSLGMPGDSLEGVSAIGILHANPASFLPDLEGALEALLKRRILAHGEQRGTYRWGRRAAEIEEFRQACELRHDPTPASEPTLGEPGQP
jgi:fatty acyl-CoA reductase